MSPSECFARLKASEYHRNDIIASRKAVQVCRISSVQALLKACRVRQLGI